MNMKLGFALLLVCAMTLFAQGTTSTNTSPYDALRNAPMFSIHGGIGGTITGSGEAMKKLLKETNAPAVFAKLAKEENAIAQAYGLLGLRLTAPAAFSKAIETVSNDRRELPVMRGCIVGNIPLDRLVAEIQRGAWDDGLREKQP